MRDTQKPLRLLIFSLLDGQIAYQDNPVPVFDEKRRLDNFDGDLCIVLSTQQETDISTSETWITSGSIDIEIVHKTDYEVTKDAIDEVSDQIYPLIFPTPMGDAPGVIFDGFQFMDFTRTTMTRNYSVTSAQTIIAKIITVTAQIVQQSP